MGLLDDLAALGEQIILIESIHGRPGHGGGIVLGSRLARQMARPEVDDHIVIFDAAGIVAHDRLEGGDDVDDFDVDAALLVHLAARAVGKTFAQVDQAARQPPRSLARRLSSLHQQDFARPG